MTKPEPLDWAIPLGRRFTTVTTVGSSSFTTSTTTSLPGAGMTVTGRAVAGALLAVAESVSGTAREVAR